MKINYQPVRPAIVDMLKNICGEDRVIFGDEKKLRKHSQSRKDLPHNH